MSVIKSAVVAAGLSALVLANLGCVSPNYQLKKTGNKIKNIILKQATQHQTVMFGEIHEHGEDNDFVISIIPELKKIGYNILVVEDLEFADDVIQRYANGEDIEDEFQTLTSGAEERYGKKLIREAGKLGFTVRAFDGKMSFDISNMEEHKRNNLREKITWKNIKKEIFDKDSDSRVVFFYGAKHISEQKNLSYTLLESYTSNFTPLGYYLERYGKNLSVSMVKNITKIPSVDLEFGYPYK